MRTAIGGPAAARCASCAAMLRNAPPALVLISISFGPAAVMWKSNPMKTPAARRWMRAMGGAWDKARS